MQQNGVINLISLKNIYIFKKLGKFKVIIISLTKRTDTKGTLKSEKKSECYLDNNNIKTKQLI